MKVKRAEAVKMFQTLGRKSADSWDDAKLKKRIKNMKEDYEDAEIPAALSKEDSIFSKILNALDNKEKVVLTSDGEAEEEPAQEKKGKKDKKDKKTRVVSKEEYETGKKPEKEKKVKKEKAKKIGRIATAVMALKGVKKSISKSDLADAADELYVKHGGTANKGQAEWSVRMALDVCEALGRVEISGETVKVVKEKEE